MKQAVECLMRFQKSAAPVLAAHDGVGFYVDVDRNGESRRGTLAEALKTARELPEDGRIFSAPDFISVFPQGDDDAARAVFFRRVFAVPARRYWTMPQGGLLDSEEVNGRLEGESPRIAGLSEFPREEMADVMAWHALQSGLVPNRIDMPLALRFVRRWFRKLGFRPALDDASFIAGRMLVRMKERLRRNEPAPKRLPAVKPSFSMQGIEDIDPDPGETVRLDLNALASEGVCMGFVSEWRPEDAGIAEGGRFSNVPARAGCAGFGRRRILCRFLMNGKQEEDLLTLVWTPPEKRRLLETFLEACAWTGHAGAWLFVDEKGRASCTEAETGRRKALPPFGRDTLKSYYRFMGREGMEIMDALEPKLPGDLSGILSGERFRNEIFCRMLEKAAAAGVPFRKIAEEAARKEREEQSNGK